MAPQYGGTALSNLNIESEKNLYEYLRGRGLVRKPHEFSASVLKGGVSNRTVLVAFEDGRSWVMKQALAKLRVEVEWRSDPARAHREALGIRWLSELLPSGAIPRLVFEDSNEHLLAMEAVPTPHENWKALLLGGDVSLEYVQQYGELLGLIHGRAAERLGALRPDFGDRQYFEALRVEPYYHYTATRVPQAAMFLEQLASLSMSRGDTLVHGDYSPKNVLIHERRLILLDHEVIHIGDPGFDLGFGLTHLLSKAHHLKAQREVLATSALQFWKSYWSTLDHGLEWSASLEHRAVSHAIGCLLARVAGRSPLEYLSPEERHRQRTVALGLLRSPPGTIRELVDEFVGGLS